MFKNKYNLNKENHNLKIFTLHDINLYKKIFSKYIYRERNICNNHFNSI